MSKLLLLALGAMGAMCMCLAGSARADDATGPGRMYFVAVGKLDAAKMSDPDVAKVMSGHIEYLGKLYDEGKLLMGGPFADTGTAGMLIIQAASLDEAKQLLAGDPSIQAGILQPVFLRPFFAAFSKPDNHRFSMDEMAAMMASGAMEHADSASPNGDADLAGASAGGGSTNSTGGMMPMTPGAVSFIQIPSGDIAASSKFYSTVFGWQTQTDPATGMTFYTAPGGMMGEFSKDSKPAAPMTGPVFFINADSVKAKLADVTANGGQVYQPEMALPSDWGHIAIIGDTSGNAVGIWSQGE